MKTILAGNFATKAKADSAIKALVNGGIKADHINSSYVPGSDVSQGPVDALLGSITGAVGRMVDNAIALPDDTGIAVRVPGVHVSVDAPAAAERAYAAGVLRQGGARDVAEAEQTWLDGHWVGDATATPKRPPTDR